MKKYHQFFSIFFMFFVSFMVILSGELRTLKILKN
jgi:hypothetical protein